MRRVVVVSDNPLVVTAIRTGVRRSRALALTGFADLAGATAEKILRMGADVVLIDEVEGSDLAVDLIRGLRERSGELDVIVLTLGLEGGLLQRALRAGANGAISKAVRPAALAALVREASEGGILYAPPRLTAVRGARGVLDDTRHGRLTEREREILCLVASGMTNGAIARQLGITEPTVKFHVSNIYRKVGVANRAGACRYAHLYGIAAARQRTSDQQTEVLAITS